MLLQEVNLGANRRLNRVCYTHLIMHDVNMSTLTFRLLAPDNYPRLLCWLQREHVQPWWNDGVGARARRAFIAVLIEQHDPRQITIDPSPDNALAWNHRFSQAL